MLYSTFLLLFMVPMFSDLHAHVFTLPTHLFTPCFTSHDDPGISCILHIAACSATSRSGLFLLHLRLLYKLILLMCFLCFVIHAVSLSNKILVCGRWTFASCKCRRLCEQGTDHTPTLPPSIDSTLGPFDPPPLLAHGRSQDCQFCFFFPTHRKNFPKAEPSLILETPQPDLDIAP